jgi:hypothetical protein
MRIRVAAPRGIYPTLPRSLETEPRGRHLQQAIAANQPCSHIASTQPCETNVIEKKTKIQSNTETYLHGTTFNECSVIYYPFPSKELKRYTHAIRLDATHTSTSTDTPSPTLSYPHESSSRLTKPVLLARHPNLMHLAIINRRDPSRTHDQIMIIIPKVLQHPIAQLICTLRPKIRLIRRHII